MTMSLKERQEKLLEILRLLRDKGDFDQAKAMFNEAFSSVSVKEITEAERALIAGGLNPQEIQNLCTVHAEVFRGSIGEQEAGEAFARPGHPVQTLKQENVVLTSLVNDALLPDLAKYEAKPAPELLAKIKQELADLAQVDKHYTRKEISMFPLMTKYGITAPPQVMWGVDDDIRAWIKEARQAAETGEAELLAKKVKQAAEEVTEMIFKEEAIMLPLLTEVATPADWLRVKEDEPRVGYCLIPNPPAWRPSAAELAEKKAADPAAIAKWNDQIGAFAGQLGGNEAENYQKLVEVEQAEEKARPALTESFIEFAEGSLSYEQLSAVLDLLPLDLVFVDKDDVIRYFGGSCGFYPHSKNDLGMNLFSIHMPKSVPKVKAIVDDLRSGRKDKHAFWFEVRGRFVYIQYMAVRNKAGEYLGVLEVLQDITDLRALQGKKKEL